MKPQIPEKMPTPLSELNLGGNGIHPPVVTAYEYNKLIDYLHELTSRIDTIEGNQLEMKQGKRCPEEDFGFEPKDQPKCCLQHFLQIDPTDGYQIVSYGFETHEAAEAYKAKLLSDNAQV